MEIKPMSNCALREIAGISYDASAKDTLIKFCKDTLGTGHREAMSKYYLAGFFSFYIFSAAVSHDETRSRVTSNRLYGDEFAPFLKENKLGLVTESPVRPNKSFHPDSSNKVWIWAIDHDAVTKWWQAYLKETGLGKEGFKVPQANYMEGLDFSIESDPTSPQSLDAPVYTTIHTTSWTNAQNYHLGYDGLTQMHVNIGKLAGINVSG